MIKLQHDKANCIGCGACEAVAGDFFEMKDDGKVQLKNSKEAGKGIFELEIKEKDFHTVKDAADSCPVNVIHIIKDGKKVI
ncbi:MAG: ferredoxin [Candidatus Woesearchaeota archaeon]